MKLGVIVNAQEGLNKLDEQDLPGALGFRINTLIQSIQPHYDNYCKQKDKLLIKYGTDKGNGTYEISGDNIKLYQKEMLELLELNIGVEFQKIEIPLDKVIISSKNIRLLQDFVDFTLD